MHDTVPENGIKDRKTLFRMFAEEVQPFIAAPSLDEEAVRRIIDERMSAAVRVIELQRPDADPVRIDDAHSQFDELLQLVREGHQNILLVGPAGSGKTTLGKSLAKALSLGFGFISLSAGVTESHLLGRTMPQADGSWKYEPSLFVRTYTAGGVFLLDEIDAADANVMVSVNAALANGVLALPNGEIVERHKDCYIVAAANTFGRGANAMYVGRNALDAATLDRFVLATVQVGYDPDLELRLALGIANEKGESVIRWVGAIRQTIETNRLRRVASTRLVVAAAKSLANGGALSGVAGRFFRDWTPDELTKVDASVVGGKE